MGGLITKNVAAQWIQRTSAASTRWTWNVRQHWHTLTRSYGIWEWCLVLVCTAALVSTGITLRLHSQVRVLEMEQANLRPGLSAALTKVDASSRGEAEQRLREFEQALIPHENIPQALGDLLRVAEDEGLLIRRADYRPTEDIGGHFLRYRIHMPIKGTSESIHRYLRGAMHAQRNLILESVQLKREASESEELEANVQWVLLTRPAPVNLAEKKGQR